MLTTLAKILDRWPGEKYFGIYRFIPMFFAAGATIEFAMIKWRPNGVNFYEVFKRKQADRLVESELKLQEIQRSLEKLKQ
ncbi:Uncharacterised protein g4299 [Pycnogonum litorale]